MQVSEHLDWAIDNLPICLASGWFGGQTAELLLGFLEQHVHHFRVPLLPPMPPVGSFSVKSRISGVTRKLSLSADQLAAYVTQNIMRRHGGPTTLPWWPVIVQQRHELLLYRKRGCRFTATDRSKFRDHYDLAFKVADNVTLKVSDLRLCTTHLHFANPACTSATG